MMTERGQPNPYRFKGERMGLNALRLVLIDDAKMPEHATVRMEGDRVYLVGPEVISFPRSLADDAVWDVGPDWRAEPHAP